MDTSQQSMQPQPAETAFESAQMKRVVVLSTADFDAPTWTNKQHIAVGLASELRVTYIESLGLRRPTLRLADVFRLYARLKDVVSSRRRVRALGSTPEEKPEKLNIVTPVVIPFHGVRAVAWINKWLIHMLLLKKLEAGGPFLLWAFSPITYGIEKHADRVIYHSVDLLHELPGVPKRAMIDAEVELLKRADYVLASSQGVSNHLKALGRAPDELWENVASVELFSGSGSGSRAKRAIFAGNLTPTKVDARAILSIADSGIEVVLAGPRSIDGIDSDKEFAQLFDHPRIAYLGNLSLDALAAETASSMVGLIPYKINAYTEGVFPMKVYEYLSAGLEVISTPLPSLNGREINGLLLSEIGNFSAAAVSAVDGFSEDQAQDRINSAAVHSWTNRFQQARGLVNQLLTNQG